MKKTVMKCDGSVEIMEGTPEEFAKLEQALYCKDKKQPEKDKAASQPSVDRMNLFRKHDVTCLLTQASRGWWAVTPPVCTCGANSGSLSDLF